MHRLLAFLKKPYYAWRGLSYVLRRESSFRFQLVVVALAVALGWYYSLSATGWALLALACASVLVLEVLNTVLERLLDVLEPRFSQHVALLKDLLAAAALIMGLSAIAVAAIVLFEHLG